MRWTKIGAIGSWAGSVFGAVALVISLLAFRLPQKVKIHASISSGFMLSQVRGTDRLDAYIITVRNVGIKPVTVKNVYLNFGKKDGDLFIGAVPQGTLLEVFMPKFPIRLEQGESFEYYLPKQRWITLFDLWKNKGP